MTQYSWHVIRADSERERAALAEDEAIARLHDELAELHLMAADGLSETWHVLNVPQAEAEADESPVTQIRPLFACLYAAVTEPTHELLPPALLLPAQGAEG